MAIQSPVTAAVGKYTAPSNYGGNMSSFGGTANDWNNMQGFGSQKGTDGGIGDYFGGNNMWQNVGAGAGALKDLFGIYAQMQGMDMAKTGINNQATAYNNNAQNQQNFTNGTIDVFGSGQQKTNNQMAQTV